MTASTVAAPLEAATTGRPRAVYTRMAATGLLLAAAAPALMLSAALVAGMSVGEDGVFFVVAAAVPLLAAGLVWRFGAWAKVLGALLSVAAGLALFWTVFGLAYPASFADFLPGVLLPLGVVLGLVGSVAGLVQHRRGHLEVAASRGERRVLTAALALVGVAILASGAASIAARSSVGAAAGAVPVTMSDFAFDQAAYEVPAGETTAMLVHNSDAFVHTFTIPELGIDQTLLPGQEALVEVTADAGTYTLYCKPHSDMTKTDPDEAGMAATVTAR